MRRRARRRNPPAGHVAIAVLGTYAAITVYRIATKGSTEAIWRQALWPVGLLLGASAR